MIIIDEILSKESCSSLINLFKNNPKEHLPWRDTMCLQLRNDETNYLMKLMFMYSSYLNQKGIMVFPELIQIVEWKPRSKQDPHFDTERDTTHLTSITYLNDDFLGGKTCFENGIEVNPKTGTTVFFDGVKEKHWVSEIQKDIRYTLAIWYTSDINLIYK